MSEAPAAPSVELPITLTIGEVLAVPAGRDLLQRYVPQLLASPELARISILLVRAVMRTVPALRDDAQARERFLRELHDAVAPARAPRHVRLTRNDPEPQDGPTGDWRMVSLPTRWGVAELQFTGPAGGNPFVDVDLEAELTCGDRTWTVGGFYDGDGVYRVRVLAEEQGEWTFTTRSNAPGLAGITGRFSVGPAAPDAHGPVRAEGFHFRHADGTRHRPWGTTAYVWNHQPAAEQEQTLRTLADSPFTKLRMCLFPKHFVYNNDEPARVPFVRAADGSIDVTRFDVDFFAGLDEQIAALGRLGIEADLILFHPYDRWGFADLGSDVDDHVVRYVVRRLAAYANVWWSLANEHDVMTSKSTADWDRIGELVRATDPHAHLLSIHNFSAHFDHRRNWITHASVQRTDPYRTAENTDEWRERWGKPVVVDECAYEGDLEFDWGNISGEEMIRRFWEGAVRGGYVGHGETYWNAQEKLWWAKGGQLHGTSHERIAFLERIVAESPTGVLEPVMSQFDLRWAGVDDAYLVGYHGAGQMRERHVLLPPGRWYVDVLDTWNCTIDRLPGQYETFVLISLTGRPYSGVRLVAVPQD